MSLQPTFQFLKEVATPPPGIGIAGPEVDAFRKAAFDDNRTLQEICDRIDMQLAEFMEDPAEFYRSLKLRIQTEPLASRFYDHSSEGVQAMLITAAFSAFPTAHSESEISMKRHSLLSKLQNIGKIEVQFEHGEHPVEAAALRLRDVLLDFEFAKAE